MNKNELQHLFAKPFFSLLNQAYRCHQENFAATDIETAALLSIKTGACPENCAYCPQSGHFKTEVKKEKLLSLQEVRAKASHAKAMGAKRFCLGAAWKSPPKKDFPIVIEMIKAINALGLESCVTLGMLNDEQAQDLKAAGLDFYNHNIDTSESHYQSIVSTRSYQDRLDTLAKVAQAGIHICCGGILGMGESRDDIISMLLTLKSLPTTPQSIPINQLIPIPGTPLAKQNPIDSFEFIRSIAVTRLLFPKSRIRLSAGRENMSDEMQAWCFMAGANSIFIGDQLLTAKNPSQYKDLSLLKKLDLVSQSECHVA